MKKYKEEKSFLRDNQKQVGATIKSREIGAKLVKTHPEVVNLYEQGLTYAEIAKKVIPNTAKQYPEVASKAIGYAVRAINPDSYQKTLTSAHRRATLRDVVGDRNSQENKKIWREAQKRRTEIHGAPTEELIRGRGQTPWSDEEKEILRELLTDNSYTKNTGTPDYEKIATRLNQIFHEGNETRNKKSLGNYVRDLRRKDKKK